MTDKTLPSSAQQWLEKPSQSNQMKQRQQGQSEDTIKMNNHTNRYDKSNITLCDRTYPVEENNPCQRLQVSLTIIAVFENVDAFQNAIRESMDFPGGENFEINFISQNSMAGIKMSRCSFEILTYKSITAAKTCVESMAARLRDSLKTIVEFYFHIDRNNDKYLKHQNQSENQRQPLNSNCDARKPGNLSSQVVNERSKIEEILSEMELRKDHVLAEHDTKMSSFREKIESLEQIKRPKANEAEKKTTEDKLLECIKQREAYLSQCQVYCTKIQNMNSLFSEKEIYKIKTDFGIECQRLLNALPIYARRKDIISHVKLNQVSIILGETGSGKSTQIAQYLHEAGIVSKGVIVCAQPRKVAAVQLADRVAQELGEATGGVVGYKTGNKRKGNDDTKIMFMTDHSLLNECLEDRDFNRYSCIIVDEAHERSIYTDILLGMIKACLGRRPDLRVVITSATIDPRVFINYFQCPEEIRVSGRTYPVEVSYMDSLDDFENYETKAVSKAVEIHRSEPEGDILVFLTSAVEIQRCCEEFCNIFKGRNDFECLPLHGQLLPEEQKKVFARLNEGMRKVVFATNCAETSITIDGIKYVIDTGVSKEMRYDAKKNLNLLGVHMISQSSADQRKGRAGRTASGKCYRLFSEEGYQAMRTINEPEILRIHLGQAILKLAELGVNIRNYDFVEAPSEDALLAAIETLEFLGAISDEKITELGRWISKLPFDPKLGYIVYKANLDGLLYDAVVLASVVSNGSSIFYRGMTETEAQISARSKAQFGLESGDIFTWLTIYKIWEGKSTRREWCRSNSINNKSMNYTKACIEETITVLKHELKVDVEMRFSEKDSAVTALSKHMLRAYGLSLCHFMGHNRAGYFSIFSERQVHVHPSCTLAAQNLQPEWVVFVELIKTSREFIKGILVVDEEWIQEAVDEGHFEVNIAKAKAERLTVVHKEELGGCVFRAVVGPRFTLLKSLEEMCEASGMKHPFLEADRDLGTICIYSSSPAIHPDVVERLQEVKFEAVSKLEEEESECKIFNKESGDSPNIRALLGPGACVRQVLMPHQSFEVLLRKVGDASEEDILMKFSAFGNIMNVISFYSEEPWGFIRYRSAKEAAIAVEKTKQDEQMIGCLMLQKGDKNTRSFFQAKASWLRRPVKGDGMAFIKCDPMITKDLIGQSLFVNGGFQSIRLAKQNRQTFPGQTNCPTANLVIFKIGKDATEDGLKGLITQELLRGVDTDLKITIPREKVCIPTERELELTKDKLRLQIDPNGEEDFNIRMPPPLEHSWHQIAFLQFTDALRGLRVCERLNRRVIMGSEPVTFTPSIRTTIHIPQKIKDACQVQIDELLSKLKRDFKVDLKCQKWKEGHTISIRSDKPEDIVTARECIMKLLKGKMRDCSRASICHCLLSEAGQNMLQKTQESTGCAIISDKRTKTIHLYGETANVLKANTQIDEYLLQNEGKQVRMFRLKCSGKPPGLMKALMNQFGPLLDGLSEKYQLTSVLLDCRTHVMKCSGSDALIEDLEGFMLTLENDLFESMHVARNKNLPECVVCLDDVESKEGLYRLEACGHPYCIPCLEHQTLSCVQSNQFPLMCAKDGCRRSLVWKDLRYIFAKNWVTEEKLIQSSINFLVSSQPSKYKFCPTPNCPVVYEITLDEVGREFNCAACFASTCSSCHVPSHSGVSCKMAKSGEGAESYLKKWCAEDPDKRKICPGCKGPIEKTGGCNKMHCIRCHTIFCWLCRAVFKTEGSCYDHLSTAHAGIFDA